MCDWVLQMWNTSPARKHSLLCITKGILVFCFMSTFSKNSFDKIAERMVLPNHFYRGNVTAATPEVNTGGTSTTGYLLAGGTYTVWMSHMKDATTAAETRDALNDYIDTKFYTIISYIAITIALLGIFGNTLIVKFMTCKPFSGMPHSLLCVALALSDLTYNIVVLTVFALFLVSGVSVDHVNSGLCKFVSFITVYVIHLDSSLVTALTLERIIAVCKPMKVASIVTKFRVRLVIFGIFFVYLLFDGERMIRKDIVPISYEGIKIQTCADVNYLGLPKKVFEIKEYLSEALNALIPMTIIIPSNIIILVKFHQHKRARAHLGSQGSNQPGMGKMTAMVLTMTTGFVFLMSPYTLYYYIFGIMPGWDHVSDTLIIIGSINPSINIWLYIVSGQSFRQEVMSWIKRRCPCFRSTDQPLSNVQGRV